MPGLKQRFKYEPPFSTAREPSYGDFNRWLNTREYFYKKILDEKGADSNPSYIMAVAGTMANILNGVGVSPDVILHHEKKEFNNEQMVLELNHGTVNITYSFEDDPSENTVDIEFSPSKKYYSRSVRFISSSTNDGEMRDERVIVTHGGKKIMDFGNNVGKEGKLGFKNLLTKVRATVEQKRLAAAFGTL